MSEHKQGFFDGASPKLLFSFGLSIGVTVVALLAFGVTLGIAVDDSSDSGSSADGSDSQQVAGADDSAAGVAAAPEASGDDIEALLDGMHLRGDEGAEITIVEFSDFECPFCERAHPTVKALLEANSDTVNWGYRHLPLTSIHPQAQPAAEASECAAEQGAFWEFTDAMYENQDRLGAALYSEVAADLGLKTSQFQSCVDDGKYESAVLADQALATTFGATGTPHFVMINNKTGEWDAISGALPQASFQQAVDAMLGS